MTTKASLLLALLALAALAAPTAAEKLIYDDWVYTRQSIRADDMLFIAYLENYTDRYVTLSHDSYVTVIYKEQCEKINLTRVCYNASYFDPVRQEYKARLLIYSLAPQLEINRTISKSALLFEEEATIEVTIANTGWGAAYNVNYEDFFPEPINLTWTSGATINRSMITWHRDSLLKGEAWSFSYKIKPFGQADYTLRAKLTYFDGLKQRELLTSPIRITSSHFLDTRTGLSTPSIDLGETANLTLNLTNPLNESIRIHRLELKIPAGLELIDWPAELERIGSSLVWKNARLGNKTSKDFLIELKGVKVGGSDIYADIFFGTKHRNYSIRNHKTTLAVNMKELSLTLELPSSLEAYEKERARLWVRNQLEEARLKKLNITIDTELIPARSLSIDWLGKGAARLVLDAEFFGPEVPATKVFSFNVYVSYATEYDDNYTKELKHRVTVKPVDVLTLTHHIDKTRPEEGDEVKVRVSVKNNRPVATPNVNVYELVSPELIILEGPTRALISLAGLSTLDAYLYKLKAPRVPGTYSINTTALYIDNVTGKRYIYSKSNILTVIEKKPKLSVTRSFADPILYEGEIAPLDYTVKNDDDELLKDILIEFPLHEEVDLVDDRNYSLAQLNQGELVHLRGIEKIRPKFNKTLRIEGPLIKFRDEEGYPCNISLRAFSIAAKPGYLQGPAIMIFKSTNVTKTYQGLNFTVLLRVQNIGTAPAVVKLTDQAKQWQLIDLLPDTESLVSYEASIEQPGIAELPPALAVYAWNGKTYTTISNAASIEVLEKVLPALPAPPPAPPVEIVKPPKPKTLLERIIDFILKILLFKKE